MSPTAKVDHLAAERARYSARSPTVKVDHLAARRVRRSAKVDHLAAERVRYSARSPTAKADHLAAQRVRRSANKEKYVAVAARALLRADPAEETEDSRATPVASSAAAPAADAADDAQDIGPAPERGLIIAKQWLSEILAGRKTLEIRSKNHSFAGQRVYLVEKGSGLVRGTVVMGEPRRLTAAEHASNQEALEFCNYAKPVAWPLLRVTLFDEAWVTTGAARTNCQPWILRHRWERDPSEQPEDLSQLRGGTLVVPVYRPPGHTDVNGVFYHLID